jgi:PadR family transcriptional regulator PadR
LSDKVYADTLPRMTRTPASEDDRSHVDRELKRGALELVVLRLLAAREAYGYEIVTTLAERTNGSLTITDGTLYPVLYRLERAGHVSVRWQTQERGVPRKYYRLTPGGEQELGRLTEEWQTFSNAMNRLLKPDR